MSSCSHSCGDASHNDKPRHVRRLNFGQSILGLDAAEQRSMLNCVLVIDQNVAHIPCTEKRDYVRKWIETHGDYDAMPSDDSSQPLPALGTSATKASGTSPVFSNSRKRARGKTGINRHAKVKKVDNADWQQNAEHSANCASKLGCCESEEKHENKQQSLSETQCTPPLQCTEKVFADETSPVINTDRVINTSPVINTYRVSKKRRTKLHEPEDGVCSRLSKLHDNDITSTNVRPVIESNNNYSALRDVPTDDKLEEISNVKDRISFISTGANKNPQICQKYREVFLLTAQERFNFPDSSSDNTDKDNPGIETSTSNDSKDEEHNVLLSTHSSSNNNISDLIEDTQEDLQKSQVSLPDRLLTFSKPSFTSSQSVADDLNETYCSEVESTQDQSTHLSAKISEVLSLNKITQKTSSRSTQTDLVISTISTPLKESPDKSVHTCLLDSGKKRHKPKKGSMVARLQSLVNAQVSGIRIWRHQINKKQNAESAEFISVFVRNCTERFSNQFLDGILIEDRFNLLQSNTEIGETGLQDAQSLSKEASHKNIMIMLVCDMVGTLKIMSRTVINVYPPWNILDKANLTLEATYVCISDNQDISNVTINSPKREKRVIKRFNCPCIEEQRELPFCARKSSSDKPDVMQRVFDF